MHVLCCQMCDLIPSNRTFARAQAIVCVWWHCLRLYLLCQRSPDSLMAYFPIKVFWTDTSNECILVSSEFLFVHVLSWVSFSRLSIVLGWDLSLTTLVMVYRHISNRFWCVFGQVCITSDEIHPSLTHDVADEGLVLEVSSLAFSYLFLAVRS